MTELDPKAAAERLTHYAAGHPRAYETQPHGQFDKSLKADIRTLLKALAASQQQGPEIKGLEPSLAYQLAEEATCDCGAGHGALEPHISTCAWQTSQWKAWGDAFNAYPEMSEAFSHAYYLITGKSPQWGPAFGINEALREIDDAQRVLRLSIKSAPSVGAEEPSKLPSGAALSYLQRLRRHVELPGEWPLLSFDELRKMFEEMDHPMLQMGEDLRGPKARAPSPHKGEPVCWRFRYDRMGDGQPWHFSPTDPGELQEGYVKQPLYAIPQAPIPEGMVRETGWLIEWQGRTPPVWFQLVGDDNWTSDSLKALRFGRKQDADAYIADIGWTAAIASEHEWSDPSPKYLARREALAVATPAPQAEPGAGE